MRSSVPFHHKPFFAYGQAFSATAFSAAAGAPESLATFWGARPTRVMGLLFWRFDRSARPAGQQPTMPSAAAVGVSPTERGAASHFTRSLAFRASR